MTIATRHVGAVLSLLLSLTGCTGLFHSNARPEEVYYLRAAPVPAGSAPVAASLRFNRPSAPTGAEAPALRLSVGGPGSLEQLVFQPSRRRAPGPGEVELRVQAVGLNFKDVLKATRCTQGWPRPLSPFTWHGKARSREKPADLAHQPEAQKDNGVRELLSFQRS